MTLNELLKEHPDWADLDVVLYTDDGTYEYLGECMTAYIAPEHKGDVDHAYRDEDSLPTGRNLLVFAGN